MRAATGPVTFEGLSTPLVLGTRRFDVRHRALVSALVDAHATDPVGAAREGARAGADLVEVVGVGGAELKLLHAVVDGQPLPVAATLVDPGVLGAAVAAGVVLVRGARPDISGRLAGAMVPVILPSPVAPVDETTARVVLVEPTDADAWSVLAGRGRLLVVSDDTFAEDDDPEAVIAGHSLGVSLGARLLRTADVRGARRVADVMAAVLGARHPDRSA